MKLLKRLAITLSYAYVDILPDIGGPTVFTLHFIIRDYIYKPLYNVGNSQIRFAANHIMFYFYYYLIES